MLTQYLFFTAAITIFAITMMVVAWRFALRIQNLSIIDIVWTYGFILPALAVAILGNGAPIRRVCAATIVVLWSLRLGTHVAKRVISLHPKEDARYGKLRTEWGTRLTSKTFWLFQWQAWFIGALSSIFIVPCLNPAPGISPLECIGIGIWALGILGETVADHQLKQFKCDPNNEHRICQKGLWNYSRHPNYFFEFMVWVGFFVFAWASPGGCYTILCPALMLFFLLRVTGIPLTEQLSIERKGEAYRQYQRTTSSFVPWFHKNL